MRAFLYTVQGLPTGYVSILPRPRGGDWLLDEAQAIREAGVDVVVSCLTPEEEIELQLTEEELYCKQQGLIYVSFPILDMSVPSLSQTTCKFFMQLYDYLSQGMHIAVHCRQGYGRSPLVAACLLVSTGLTAEAACDRVGQARGRVIPETEEQREWIELYAARYGAIVARREQASE